MYTNITEYCKEVIGRSSRTFAASFLYEDVRYSDIKSMKILVPSAQNGMVTLGATISNSAEIMIEKADVVVGKSISVYESVKQDSGEYEDIPMGMFYITKSSTTDSVTTIMAEGPLSYNSSKGYFSELQYPAKTTQMLNEISRSTGIEFDTSNLEDVLVETKPEGYTCREVIGFIAAMHGTNAMESRSGTVVFKWFEHCDEDIFTDKIGSPELENDLYVINKFECVKNETSISRGNGTTGISISNPLMTETVADMVWSKISGFSFRPGTFPIMMGNPCVDPWDSFIYNNERVIATELEYVHDGGLQSTYSSAGGNETVANEGPITAQMKRYYAELVIIKEAMIDKLSAEEADIRYLKADSIDAITLEVKEAAIKELSADFATVEMLEVGYANIALSNVEKSTIGTLFADIGLITSATIVDGHVTGFLDSVEVNANSITAGTLSVDRLIFRGSAHSIVYELNNITGALQAVQDDTLNGEILTDRSITVDKIVAKSITANEIAAETITAYELASNSVTSAKIVSGAITADKIAANSITGDKIVAKTITADEIDIVDLFAQDITSTGTIRGVSLEIEDGTIASWQIEKNRLYKEYDAFDLVEIPTSAVPDVAVGEWNWEWRSSLITVTKYVTELTTDGIYHEIYPQSSTKLSSKFDALGIEVNGSRVIGFTDDGAVTASTMSVYELYVPFALYSEHIYARGNIVVLGNVHSNSVIAKNGNFEILTLIDDAGIGKKAIQLLNPTPSSPSTAGSELLFGAGGNVFVGAGESPGNLRTALNESLLSGEVYGATNENTYISSDSNVMIYSGCNTIANRKCIVFNGSGHLYPLIDAQASCLGVSAHPWSAVYADTGNFTTISATGAIVGDLTGNADTATQATNSSKVYSTLTNPSSAASYYIPFHSGASSANKSLLNNNGLYYRTLEGTASALGQGILAVGNDTASGTAGNKYGTLRLFGESSKFGQIRANNVTADRTLQIPDKSGTIAITDGTVYGQTTGTFTDDSVLGVYGYVTSDGTEARLHIPMNFQRITSGKTLTITAFTGAIRTSAGGYLISNGANLKSYITEVAMMPNQGMIRIALKKSDGWGVTNNTPLSGDAKMSYKITA